MADERKLPCSDTTTMTIKYRNVGVGTFSRSSKQTQVMNAMVMLPAKH
jgi:hypothetical protein